MHVASLASESHPKCFQLYVLSPSQGISLEKKEARLEKEEAERYQKLQQEMVR